MRVLKGYAAPLIWGPDLIVASNLGSVTYSIDYTADGDTLVTAKVKYFADDGNGGDTQKEEEFKDSITITTSNSVANVTCNFKGTPTGSAVTVTVDP